MAASESGMWSVRSGLALLHSQLPTSHFETDGYRFAEAVPPTDLASARSARTYVSQPCGSAASPRTVERKMRCSSLVTGPGFPWPTVILSTLRIGVISDAVPERKTSSAM